MFRNFLKNRKGQNTAEYALLIALVVAGIIAMQQYAQRALQGRVRDASAYLTGQTIDNTATNGSLTTAQYEPYYMQSNYQVSRNAEDTRRMDNTTIASNATSNRQRQGEQRTTYNSVPSGL